MSMSSEALLCSDFNINEFSLNGLSMLGKVVYVYDGDTVHIVFDLNNKLTKFTCRLAGVDSPEICPRNIPDPAVKKQEMESAIRSRNYLIEQVTDQPITKVNMTKKDIKELCAKSRKLVWVKCQCFDKYGRLLVEVFKNDNDTISVNQDLITKKYCVAYDGGTKEEFNTEKFN